MMRQAQAQRAGHGALRSVPRGRENSAAPDYAHPRGRKLRRAAIFFVCLGVLGVGGWYANAHRNSLLNHAKAWASRLPAGLLDAASGKGGADRKGLATSPLLGFKVAPEALDPTLQATPLWRVLKRDYPEWYAERLKEISGLAADNKRRYSHRPARSG